MAKSAKPIEPEVLQELTRLGADRGPLAAWLAGLESSRESVSEAVYRRVREDYTKRIADLDRLTKGLRIEATRTIAVFDEQLAQLESEKQRVEFDLQEVELRRWLEEYSEAEFKERVQVPRERIDELGVELGKLRETRELWVAARGEPIAQTEMRDEMPEAPEPPKAKPAGGAAPAVNVSSAPAPSAQRVPPVVMAPPAPTPHLAPRTPPASSAPTPANTPSSTVGVAPNPVEITLPHPLPPPRPSSPAIPLPQTAEAAARTAYLAVPAAPAPPSPPPAPAVFASVDAPGMDHTVVYTPEPPSPPPAPPVDAPGMDHTVMYTPEPPPSPVSGAGNAGGAGATGDPGASTLRLQASLIPVEPADSKARAHSLAPENTIGRVRENSIQVQDGSVSRHHALLRYTADGWTLEDLEAENGTWVNGDRIEKRRLADGDRVNIGTVRFVFKIG